MVSFFVYGLLINEAFEDSSCHRYVGGGMFASLNAAADDSVFTVMDILPALKNLSKVI